MLKKIVSLGMCCLVLMSMVLVTTCEKQVTGAVEETNQVVGISKDQINWISPLPENAGKLDALAKSCHAGAWVSVNRGGFVGGYMTFGNSVSFPAGAILENTYFTLDAVKERIGDKNTLSFEFLPSMTFQKPVTITLSWDFLDISYSDIQNGNFQVYYSQDGETWYPVDQSSLTPDYHNQTVSFLSDHFTRYGWGF
ncbi:MAG: hypothetical protein V1681_03730 [Candidatus Neomarinimicrobiota bacterium]